MEFTPVTPAGAAIASVLSGSGSDPERHGSVRVYLGGLGSATTVAFASVVAHPRLAGRGQNLLVDLIGSGWSDHDDAFAATIDLHAETVIGLLESLSLGSVELIGHSLGGSIAISVAAQRPDLVVKLVVVEPNLDPGVGTVSAQIAKFDEDDFVSVGHPDMVLALMRLGAGGDSSSAEYGRTLKRWSARTLHRTAVSLLAERPATFREQLAAFEGARRYISGALSNEELAPLRKLGCEVRIVENAGHDVMFDNLDGFVEALL